MNLTNQINKKIFREYDIRGIYETDLNIDVAYTIGKSFGSYVQQMYNEKKVVVGYDNRLSSPTLNEGIIQGLISSGVDVISLNLVTTPMYYYARIFYDTPAGIMITASHNPKEYNGFKISFERTGNAYGKYIQDFLNYTLDFKFISGNGKIYNKDIKEEYLNLITKSVDLGLNNKKVVLDCGNGTGSIIIKDIFDKLGVTYYPLYCESDGNFPNHHPDPSVPKNMIDLGKKVKELNYDFGIGIDGDADRVGIVDENGDFIAADLYMLIMYKHLNKSLKTRKALFDVKCSKALVDELKKLDIKPIMYRTGNSYMNMMMQKENLDFGGEFSGHLFFRDKFPGFDDGIYGGLRLLEVVNKENKSIKELLKGINKYYSTEEIKFNVTDDNKFKIVEKIKEYAKNKNYTFNDIDGIRVNFSDSWALVRCSNTGPNITARFEANTKERLNSLQNEFVDLVNKYKDEIR